MASAPVVREDLEPIGRREKLLVERWQDYLMQYNIEEDLAYEMALHIWQIKQAN